MGKHLVDSVLEFSCVVLVELSRVRNGLSVSIGELFIFGIDTISVFIKLQNRAPYAGAGTDERAC